MCGLDISTNTMIGGCSDRGIVTCLSRREHEEVPCLDSSRDKRAGKAAREGYKGSANAMLASVPWSAAVSGGGGGSCLKISVSYGSPLCTAPDNVALVWSGFTVSVLLFLLGLTPACIWSTATYVSRASMISVMSWRFTWLGPDSVILWKRVVSFSSSSKSLLPEISSLEGDTPLVT